MRPTSERILAAIDSCGSFDPHLVAKTVIAGLDPDEFVGALEDALPSLVRDVLGNLRRSTHPGLGAGETQVAPAGVGDPSSPGGAGTRTLPTGPPRRPGKSFYAKHRGVFARPYGTADGYKALGDCGLADLDWIIADRRKRAESMTEEGDKILKLRTLLRRKKAEKVSDLPVEGVEKCLR